MEKNVEEIREVDGRPEKWTGEIYVLLTFTVSEAVTVLVRETENG